MLGRALTPQALFMLRDLGASPDFFTRPEPVLGKLFLEAAEPAILLP